MISAAPAALTLAASVVSAALTLVNLRPRPYYKMLPNRPALPKELWKIIAMSDWWAWYLLHRVIKNLTLPAEYKKISEELDDAAAATMKNTTSLILYFVGRPSEKCEVRTICGLLHTPAGHDSALRYECGVQCRPFIEGIIINISARLGVLHNGASGRALIYSDPDIYFEASFEQGVLGQRDEYSAASADGLCDRSSAVKIVRRGWDGAVYSFHIDLAGGKMTNYKSNKYTCHGPEMCRVERHTGAVLAAEILISEEGGGLTHKPLFPTTKHMDRILPARISEDLERSLSPAGFDVEEFIHGAFVGYLRGMSEEFIRLWAPI